MKAFAIVVLSALISGISMYVGLIAKMVNVHVNFLGYEVFPELIIISFATLFFTYLAGFGVFDAVGIGFGGALFWLGIDTFSAQLYYACVLLALGWWLIFRSGWFALIQEKRLL